ncbi:Sister chromatid cohesion 1 protein 1 [Ananas comosus]|uniref:Sister chromatid cohesion 1 protein 1 n=1 Tax=Ananas comosus TaxID=4615 RepID=A0A199VXA6_ANACO|nr:Sister chromatid cohesion 1 protein 1 [Ananas comosus]
MALRLSGILMEINEAWRVKPASDPTVLPKGKAQAKYEAVTLPENLDVEVEQPMQFSDASLSTANKLRRLLKQPTSLCLTIWDQASEAAISIIDLRGWVISIVLVDRFDIGDDETQFNFTSQDRPQVPSAIIPSPLRSDKPPQAQNNVVPSPSHQETQRGGTFTEYHMREQEEREREVGNTGRKHHLKRKASANGHQVVMDNDQIMIPGNIYQTWLQDSSNLVSKRGRLIKPSIKVSNLMDFPPVALIFGLDKSPTEFYYPAPLLELWRKCTEVKLSNASSTEDNKHENLFRRNAATSATSY